MQVFPPVIVKLGTLVGLLEKGYIDGKSFERLQVLCNRSKNVRVVKFTSLCPSQLVFLQLQIFGFEEIEKHS